MKTLKRAQDSVSPRRMSHRITAARSCVEASQHRRGPSRAPRTWLERPPLLRCPWASQWLLPFDYSLALSSYFGCEETDDGGQSPAAKPVGRLASVMKFAGRVLGQEVEPAQRQISSVYGALLARNQEECRDIPVLLIPHCPSRPADRGNCASRGAEAGGALGCDSLRILEHPLGELPVPTVSAFLKAASEPESPRLRSQPGKKKVCEELKCRKRRRSCAGRGRCPPLTEDPQCLGQRDCWPDARFPAGRGRS